jgi:nitroimidazol reductase NimA-like FMN-containing flavoprotein (pyridoxamine 5'-phosphate oxidase superfamily)
MDDAIRQKVQSLLDRHRTMRIATLRPDGWPQVTTVGYANEGFTIYFLCGPDSQKAANIARDDRVSLAIGSRPGDGDHRPFHGGAGTRSDRPGRSREGNRPPDVAIS